MQLYISALLQLFVVIYSPAFIKPPCQKIILTSSNEEAEGHSHVSTFQHELPHRGSLQPERRGDGASLSLLCFIR